MALHMQPRTRPHMYQTSSANFNEVRQSQTHTFNLKYPPRTPSQCDAFKKTRHADANCECKLLCMLTFMTAEKPSLDFLKKKKTSLSVSRQPPCTFYTICVCCNCMSLANLSLCLHVNLTFWQAHQSASKMT